MPTWKLRSRHYPSITYCSPAAHGSTRLSCALPKNLLPVTLELGGKSPATVAPDHVNASTASGIAFGKLANANRNCAAPDYASIHEDEVDAFGAAYDPGVSSSYPTGAASLDYPSIINERHFVRLHGLIQNAKAPGL